MTGCATAMARNQPRLCRVRPAHVGLWVRRAAFAFDYLIITVYLILMTTLALTVTWIFPNLPRTLFGNPMSGQIIGFMVITLPVTMYFTLLESSFWQATWGKRWKNLREYLLRAQPQELPLRSISSSSIGLACQLRDHQLGCQTETGPFV